MWGAQNLTACIALRQETKSLTVFSNQWGIKLDFGFRGNSDSLIYFELSECELLLVFSRQLRGNRN